MRTNCFWGALLLTIITHTPTSVAAQDRFATTIAETGWSVIGIAHVVDLPQLFLWEFLDSDNDGLTNGEERRLGTDPYKRDTDGDGWVDGPRNRRISLRLTEIHCIDEQEDWGRDEIYVVVDHVRWPRGSGTGSDAINGYWSFDEGDRVTPNQIVAQRVETTSGLSYAPVTLSVYNDNPDWDDDWEEDEHLFSRTVDLAKYKHGDSITLSASNGDYDYVLRLKVEVSTFADPNPLDYGKDDTDGDGINDQNEAVLAARFSGLGDPTRKDLWVELDWMPGRKWYARSKQMVVSQFAYHNIALHVDDGEFGGGTEIPHADTLSRAAFDTLYNTRFQAWRHGVFLYAVMAGEIFNGRSGINLGDRFLVDTKRFTVNGDAEAQAGTFMHELGHSLGLVHSLFAGIDEVSSWDYESCMNYLYQYFIVDYSDGSNGDDDFADWFHLDLSLRIGKAPMAFPPF